eukprot:SAG11_NODE_1818_length_4215_cov_1.631438_7_plen_221_part_00
MVDAINRSVGSWTDPTANFLHDGAGIVEKRARISAGSTIWWEVELGPAQLLQWSFQVADRDVRVLIKVAEASTTYDLVDRLLYATEHTMHGMFENHHPTQSTMLSFTLDNSSSKRRKKVVCYRYGVIRDGLHATTYKMSAELMPPPRQQLRDAWPALQSNLIEAGWSFPGAEYDEGDLLVGHKVVRLCNTRRLATITLFVCTQRARVWGAARTCAVPCST